MLTLNTDYSPQMVCHRYDEVIPRVRSNGTDTQVQTVVTDAPGTSGIGAQITVTTIGAPGFEPEHL